MPVIGNWVKLENSHSPGGCEWADSGWKISPFLTGLVRLVNQVTRWICCHDIFLVHLKKRNLKKGLILQLMSNEKNARTKIALLFWYLERWILGKCLHCSFMFHWLTSLRHLKSKVVNLWNERFDEWTVYLVKTREMRMKLGFQIIV